MSQRDVNDTVRIIAGLERLARLARAVPKDILAAWLVFDAGLSKTAARNVADSIQKLLDVLEKSSKEVDEE